MVSKRCKKQTWVLVTKIVEMDGEKSPVLIVYDSVKGNIFTTTILYVPETIAELIALAVIQEARALRVLNILKSSEEVEDKLVLKDLTMQFETEIEPTVIKWFYSISASDFITWKDFYGQEKASPEDIIESKQFYQISKEIEEQIIDFIEGENSNG